MSGTLTSIDLPELTKLRSGKVREVFALADANLIVATDRISAFDCILPDPIPGKGAVLTQLSAFWFRYFADIPNHLLSVDVHDFPGALAKYRDRLAGRAMLVRKAEPLPVECVVRGYLAGSGWKEYQEHAAICGIRLPPGLRQAEQLPEPIFTPATKAESGHDENISWAECCSLLGRTVAETVKAFSLELYARGSSRAASHGIIIADTKFEFGHSDGKIILIDECLTPDSSRFWPAADYRVGTSPISFDKQFVRDYLETLPWNKTPPAPRLPNEVIERTAAKYREALDRLTR
jgi:phosphoribosylaminoimidazole-succinocarboxamide synthase